MPKGVRKHAVRRRRRPDAVALMVAVAVHGGIILLLMLEWFQPPPRTPTSALAVFDVNLPPPPPRLPKPLHLTPPKRSTASLPGGSPPAAEPPSVKQAEAAPQGPVLFPSERRSIASPIGDEDGDATLASTGSAGSGEAGRGGDGEGTGTGNGVGPGALRFARAQWIREPSIDEIRRYLPASALARSVLVSVKLGCIVPTPGKPKRCWIISESPRGFGFGHAAVEMSRQFRIRPVFVNDAAMDMPVLVPILFRVSPRSSPPRSGHPSP